MPLFGTPPSRAEKERWEKQRKEAEDAVLLSGCAFLALWTRDGRRAMQLHPRLPLFFSLRWRRRSVGWPGPVPFSPCELLFWATPHKRLPRLSVVAFLSTATLSFCAFHSFHAVMALPLPSFLESWLHSPPFPFVCNIFDASHLGSCPSAFSPCALLGFGQRTARLRVLTRTAPTMTMQIGDRPVKKNTKKKSLSW